ncbi:MAG: aromatic ring-hydroxylating oxygenase subunit alpha [Panacagrimonas sp.]
MKFEEVPGLVQIRPSNQSFRVHRSAYRSREVFEREKEMIFGKCWLYLGHGTELKKKGDFLTRRVGGRDLIFVRDASDTVRALFNSCTHRGTPVCREANGTARNFVCPYHGWVFANSGELRSTSAQSGYSETLNADGHLNLRAVPRLEDYRGFWFVNFNTAAISLHDYLAGARAQIDAIFDQSEAGQIVLPGEHTYTVRANYKLLCENSYDGYHLTSVHASYIDFLRDQAAGTPAAGMIDQTMAAFSTQGQARALGNGHAVLESYVPTGRPVARWIPSWGPELKKEIDAKRAWLEAKYGKERAEYIAEVQKNLVIFPNLVINDILAVTVRVIEPESPNFMKVSAWALGPSEESEALRAIRLDNFISFLGPAGFGSPDDIEMLEMCQRGIEHTPVEWTELSKGMNWETSPAGASGPPDSEVHMQAYWHQWDRVIRGIDTLETQSC